MKATLTVKKKFYFQVKFIDMYFEEGYIYHIYNQGNNRQRLFFKRENYLYFLRKVGVYIKPYADILAWCLMPNHFHLMVLVNHTVVPTVGVAQSDTDGNTGRAQSDTEGKSDGNKTRTLNESIGIMLRSYTNAINKQERRTGKLIREKTKAECVNNFKGITASLNNTANGTQINMVHPDEGYPQACFNYIHQNPVKAKLVNNPQDWEFSSYLDYLGSRAGKLVDKKVAAQYVRW